MRFETFQEWLVYAPTALSVIIPILLLIAISFLVIGFVIFCISTSEHKSNFGRNVNGILDKIESRREAKRYSKSYQNRYNFKRPNIFVRGFWTVLGIVENVFEAIASVFRGIVAFFCE